MLVIFIGITEIYILKDFSENLFQLFDTDSSCSVSLQELVGGLRRLSK